MSWQEATFRAKSGKVQNVWVRVDDDGQPVLVDGRLDMRYSDKDDAKVYSAAPRNVTLGGDGPRPKAEPNKTATKADFDELIWRHPKGAVVAGDTVPNELLDEPDAPAGVVDVWTDGACTGNPGPCGYGVIVREPGFYREISHYLGVGTNNIAELFAIKVALDETRNRNGKILIHTDSRYAIGVLTLGWKARANIELVAEIRRCLSDHPGIVELRKVKGHSGVPLNERADHLATSAVSRRA